VSIPFKVDNHNFLKEHVITNVDLFVYHPKVGFPFWQANKNGVKPNLSIILCYVTCIFWLSLYQLNRKTSHRKWQLSLLSWRCSIS